MVSGGIEINAEDGRKRPGAGVVEILSPEEEHGLLPGSTKEIHAQRR